MAGLPQVRTGVMMVQAEGYAALMSGVSATVARGLFYGGERMPGAVAVVPVISWQLWVALLCRFFRHAVTVKGLLAQPMPTAVLRANSGLRLGMYAPLKTAIGADADPTLLKKVAAGSASGAIATFITNPIELLKTRLQSSSGQGPLQVVREVLRQDGVAGLWKGTMPSAVRSPSLFHFIVKTLPGVSTEHSCRRRCWGIALIVGLAGWAPEAPLDKLCALVVAGMLITWPVRWLSNAKQLQCLGDLHCWVLCRCAARC